MTILELKNRIYNDFIASFKNAITPLKKSFFEQLSNSLSATFQLLYIYLDRIQKDSFLTSCTSDRVLNYFAPLKNITRKSPTKATASVTFYGTDATIIPTDTKLTYNNLEYTTIEPGTILNGVANVNCESVKSGTVNNTLAGIDMFLSSPIVGVNNKAYCQLGFSGAVDEETIESVRTRTRQKFATASYVNNDSFYKALANEVPNVKASFISDNKYGVGTFGITILTYSNSGVPTQADIDEVQAYFESKNAVPIYVGVDYFLPVITPVDFSIQLAINDATNQESVSTSIKDYLYLTQKPNTTYEFSGLAEYLQSLGARLVIPATTDTQVIADNEVLDVGVITWI